MCIRDRAEIVLSAIHTGSEVIISVRDDGRGMDTVKILEKAERNGLLTKPASEYSQKEILSLLMIPGFSTNEEVTAVSYTHLVSGSSTSILVHSTIFCSKSSFS